MAKLKDPSPPSSSSSSASPNRCIGNNKVRHRKRGYSNLEIRKVKDTYTESSCNSNETHNTISAKKRRLVRYRGRKDSDSSGDSSTSESTIDSDHTDDIVQHLCALISERRDPADALARLRHLLSTPESSSVSQYVVQAVMDSGVLPILVGLLSQNQPFHDEIHTQATIHLETIWILTNIAAAASPTGESDFVGQMIQAGVLSAILPHIVSRSNADIRLQAIWCVGNIAGDECVDYRDAVLESGALDGLFHNIQHPASNTLVATAVWALKNCCRGGSGGLHHRPKLNHIQCIVPALMYCLKTFTAQDVQEDVLWALVYCLERSDNESILAAVTAGMDNITPEVMDLMKSETPRLLHPGLRILRCIVSGTVDQTQCVLDHGVLDLVASKLIYDKNDSIKRDTCWMLANIAAGEHHQIEALLKKPTILKRLRVYADGDREHVRWEIRIEALWCLTNILNCGSVAQLRSIGKENIIYVLRDALEFLSSNHALLASSLEALHRLLVDERHHQDRRPLKTVFEELGGVAVLEELQEHNDTSIYNRSLRILQDIFDEGCGYGCSCGCSCENEAPDLDTSSKMQVLEQEHWKAPDSFYFEDNVMTT